MFALFLSCLGLFFYVIAGHGPAIQEIPGSCYACPRMTEEKIILSLPDFYSFLSFPYLIRESKRDVRLKAEHDIEKKAEDDREKRSNMTKKSPSSEGLFVYLLSSNGVLSRGLLWVRMLMTLTSSFFNSSRVQTMSTMPCSFRYSAR